MAGGGGRDRDPGGEGARAAGADGEDEPGGLLGERELDRLAAGELQAVAVEVDDHGHRYARLVAQRERHSPLAGGEGDRAAIGRAHLRDDRIHLFAGGAGVVARSAERRVGKEGGSTGWSRRWADD